MVIEPEWVFAANRPIPQGAAADAAHP